MSKFLRKMESLSRKPSDFQKPPAAATVSPVTKLATVDKLTTVATVATVDNLATADKLTTVDTMAVMLDGQTVNAKLCRPAVLVQHGHTPGEHAVYTALWNQGGPPDRKDDYREVSIGYDKLAAIMGGSKRNVQRLVDVLQRKLAIEVVQEEDSSTRRGKTYRVYGMTEILRRRREAGYTMVFRNRSAVELVKLATVDTLSTVANLPTVDTMATVDNMATVGSLTTETVDKLSTETVDSLSTPLGSSLEINKESSSSHYAITSVTAKHGLALDDDAIRKIIRRCRNGDEAATVQEIAYFVDVKINQLRGRRDIANWTGMLLQAVPAYFVGEKTELLRYREGKLREEAQRLHEIQTILDDPDTPEDTREVARQMLANGDR